MKFAIPPDMGKKCILVVDDTPANLKLARVVLEGAAYAVRGVRDAGETWKALDEGSFDLILMDLRLPGIDGLELTRQLRSDPRTRLTPIVALTAYAMQDDEMRALEAGCDGFMTKPIDTRTIAASVARYIERGRPNTS